MKRPTLPPLTLALLALGIAGATTLGVLRHALQSHDREAVVAETITLPSILRPHDSDHGAQYVPIADDPFFPGRTPPATRYQLADTKAPMEPQSNSPPVPQIPLVLGTVIGAAGSSFAICSVNKEPPKTVRVGGSIGDYRVEAIERGRVVFVTSNGERLTVASGQVADTSAGRRPPSGVSNPNGNSNGNADSNAANPDDQD